MNKGPAHRDDILDAEFTRPTPGLRPYSIGLLGLCRKLELNISVRTGETRKTIDSGREALAITWMMDEKNPLADIRAAVEKGWPAVDPILDEYAFLVSPLFLVRVQMEMARTQRAVAEAAFVIEPKPGAEGPQPAGK